MRVVVVGTGGREAAIARACRQHGHEVATHASVDVAALADAPPDLVLPGPEAALVAGIADRCAELGIPCFGPSAALAQLEASKGFARELATGLGVPGPRFARFGPDEAADAIRWSDDLGRPVVVKLDGLAAGKGVVVPDGTAARDDAIRAAAAASFVVEERLSGPECSLLALCDGTTARALPIAQDHKRIGEGDTGPNTGGMGAYAPAPVPYAADDLVATFVQPVLDHLRAAGTPYVGVLYAGLMLTADGPRLIEYNCRFGDPEAQAVLPLLRSDLACHALAATRGELGAERLEIADGAALTVVVAAPGYPAAPVTGGTVEIDALADDVVVLPAGMTDVHHDADGTPTGGTAAGGRVLAVTGLGSDLGAARAAAYRGVAAVSLSGAQVRRDIGWRAPGATLTGYAAAGVDIDEGERAVEAMRVAVERTHGPAVLGGVGSFGGVFSAAALVSMDDPVLVASTDGVGTKVELAARLGRVRGIGHDIVNHCIGDVLVQAARPLFFLDYVAAARLDAELVAEVVTGMAEACEAAGCALLGGETAEMPGVYTPGAFDVAGTLVGAAERAALLPRPDVAPGDVLIGVASNGPHTNGYSFLRRLFEWIPDDVVPDGFDRTIGDALLEPHRSYLGVLDGVLASGRVKALAHITGGGLPGNVSRVLPDGVDAVVRTGSWPRPPLFRLVAELATATTTEELHRTLNMGIGMVIVSDPDDVDALCDLVAEPVWTIGELVAADGPGRRVHLDRTTGS